MTMTHHSFLSVPRISPDTATCNPLMMEHAFFVTLDKVMVPYLKGERKEEALFCR